jgi:peptide/nickel transport system permease protein
MTTLLRGVRHGAKVSYISVSDAWQRTWNLRPPIISLIVIATLLACALFAPVLAPHDPTRIDVLEATLPPGASLDHVLGTDLLGRDMLSRLIFGSRTALYVIVVALAMGALIGTLLGLISGYLGGWADIFIMRVVDAVMSIPTILVAMVMVVILGPGTTNIIVAIVVTVWPHFARMIRGETLAIKEMEFVASARISGVPAHRIIARHIFPNVVSTLAILTSLRVGQVILLEASLSFLGLGLPLGAPGWGIMVSEGRDAILTAWWLALLPGVTITAVVLAFNLFGDWLRDSFDPKFQVS